MLNIVPIDSLGSILLLVAVPEWPPPLSFTFHNMPSMVVHRIRDVNPMMVRLWDDASMSEVDPTLTEKLGSQCKHLDISSRVLGNKVLNSLRPPKNAPRVLHSMTMLTIPQRKHLKDPP